MFTKRLIVRAIAATAVTLASAAAFADGSGTLNDGTLSLTHSGSLPLSNPTPDPAGATDGPDCSLGNPQCDTYTLTLELSEGLRADPANAEASVDINMSYTNNSTQTDFDLYMYDAGGNLVASSHGGTPTPEYISLPLLDYAPNGVYTVNVVPWVSAGDSFDMTLDIKNLGGTAKSGSSPFAGGLGALLLLPLAGLAALRRKN